MLSQMRRACGGGPAAAVHKGSLWTAEEDRVLVNYVTDSGAGSWDKVARAAGLNRSGRSCRLRWRNYLRPSLRRDEMTAEEIRVIVRLHSQWGNKWCKIAKQLPGRTENQVMNFWRTKTNIEQQRRQHDITPAAALCSSIDNNIPAAAGQGSEATTTTAPAGPAAVARRLGWTW